MHEVGYKIPYNIMYSTTKNQNQIKIISTKLKTISPYLPTIFYCYWNTSKKKLDRVQLLKEELEYIKGVIRSLQSKMERQHDVQGKGQKD